MHAKLSAGVIAAALAGSLAVATPASATNIGQEGCTPGYWKNHTENWEEYSPSTSLGTVFSSLAGTPYENVTLLEALSLRGGPGVDGARQILLRAATAATLNAAHEGLGYPYRRAHIPYNIIKKVNEAILSGDRQRMVDVAKTLDAANNLGCPLN